jgi:hypothetical protein
LNMVKRALVILALLAIPALASAMETSTEASRFSIAQQQPHPYRAARIAACQGKARGDACTFQGPNGTVNATCHVNHEGDMLCGQMHHHH